MQCARVAKREEGQLLPSASGGGEAAKRSACTEGEGKGCRWLDIMLMAVLAEFGGSKGKGLKKERLNFSLTGILPKLTTGGMRVMEDHEGSPEKETPVSCFGGQVRPPYFVSMGTVTDGKGKRRKTFQHCRQRAYNPPGITIEVKL